MPTSDVLDAFRRDWQDLTTEQREQFKAAVRKVVEDLKLGRGFRPSLRLKGVRSARGVYELTWAVNGRATFHYGPSVLPGEPHVIWRRIGTHEILRAP